MRNLSKLSILSLACASLACGGPDRYQGLSPDELYRMAQIEYEAEDWGNAIETLDRLIASYATWPQLPDARFLLAEAHFNNEEYLSARAEYQRFLDRYIGHPMSSAAALGQCRALRELTPNPERDQSYTREAITICGNAVVDYAGSPEAVEAARIRQELRSTLAEKEFLTAQNYFRRKQYDPAIIYYEFVVDLYPETEFAPQALRGIYRANEEIGYDDLADQARTRLLREYPNSDAAAELQADSIGL